MPTIIIWVNAWVWSLHVTCPNRLIWTSGFQCYPVLTHLSGRDVPLHGHTRGSVCPLFFSGSGRECTLSRPRDRVCNHAIILKAGTAYANGQHRVDGETHKEQEQWAFVFRLPTTRTEARLLQPKIAWVNASSGSPGFQNRSARRACKRTRCNNTIRAATRCDILIYSLG